MPTAFEIALNNCQQAHKTASEHRTDPSTGAIKRILSGESFGSTLSGISVTPSTAMRTSAVWACVRVLATGLGALPLHIYRDRENGGHDLAKNYPLYNVLHRAPNTEQTSFTFRSLEMAHLCLYGNAYAEIEFDPFGNPVALWPIPPWCCEPMRTDKTKELFYRVTIPGEGQRDLPPYRMLHVMGLGTDGMKGLSPIRLHAETIGVSIAATAFGGAFFGQGANVGGIVEHPGKLTIDGSTRLGNSLNAKYAGLGNAHRLILLEEGMKYTKVGIPPEEAQFIETLQFHIEDIARIFGVQLHKIGHLLRATNNNIEHQGIEFVTDTMLPWSVNWEMEYDRKLLKPGYYTKHSMEGLLRGDSAARAAFYRELSYISAISPNEIREKEDMNPYEGGDRYYVQANMVPADKIDQFISKPNGTRSIEDSIRRVIERDKTNIRKAFQKDPKNFDKYLDDYYRDFQTYMIKELN
jgi:HK97 family phage portal protein